MHTVHIVSTVRFSESFNLPSSLTQPILLRLLSVAFHFLYAHVRLMYIRDCERGGTVNEKLRSFAVGLTYERKESTTTWKKRDKNVSFRRFFQLKHSLTHWRRVCISRKFIYISSNRSSYRRLLSASN